MLNPARIELVPTAHLRSSIHIAGCWNGRVELIAFGIQLSEQKSGPTIVDKSARLI